MDAGPFPKAEIHLTEWSSSPSPRDHTHDFLQAATFILKANVESLGTVDSLSYWVFTDVFEEGGAGDTHFHGGFGMLTLQGIPKPSFHAYRMLNQLGDVRIGQAAGVLATRHQSSGKIAVIVYHYPSEEPLSAPASFDTRDTAQATLGKGKSQAVEVRIDDLPPGACFEIEMLDLQRGNAMGAWTEMGRPEPMTREQTDQLRESAHRTALRYVTANDNGVLLIDQVVLPWTVLLIRQI